MFEVENVRRLNIFSKFSVASFISRKLSTRNGNMKLPTINSKPNSLY
jgi:hypothetical protein